MFKKICIAITLIFLLTTAGLAQNSNNVGIGVAVIDVQQIFETLISGGVGMNATIVVPFAASPNLRIEPEFGYFRATEEDKNGTTETETATSWRVGVGIFPLKIIDSFTLYYGGRVGYISQTFGYEAGSVNLEETTTGFYIAPALGGEHSFSNHFSIGGEAQVVYATLSTDSEFTDDKTDRSLINTRVLVFIRFYF
jgi:hypothetical protein